MRFFSTTGDRGQDRQWDYTEQRLARLEALQTAPTSSNATTQTVTLSGASGLIVQQSDGTNSVLQCTTLQVDLNAGFAITASSPYALITRTATAIVPGAIASAGASGSSILSANADHTHAGVTSVATAGLLAGNVAAAQGAVTVTVTVPMVAADPGSPVAGDMWYRTDLNQLSVYTGAATKRSAAFT